ncbi:MAG TPA: lysoplasmalogenase [Bryobacteraceae bacterium]|nr:lysoplasmalogenase [Bryobacteraceae bacterium]
MRALSTSGRILILLSLVLSAAYLATLSDHHWLVKALSIATLALVPWIPPFPEAPANPALLSAALAASSLGDALLDLAPERFFVPGLSAFLAAHLIYTALFLRNRASLIGPARRLAIAAVLVYALLYSWWLAPDLGPLKIPVILYIAAITAMILSALASFFGARVAAGALLFLVSDSLLAAAKFKGPFAGRDYLVWLTYFAAQFLIATGVVRALRKEPLAAAS